MARAVTELRRRRRAAVQLATRAAVGAAGGAVTAVAVARFDDAVGARLPVPIDHAQLLLGTLAGATITVVVFALWMRTVVVGLLSDQVSPRIVTAYLDDSYQRLLIAIGVGFVTFLSVAVLTLPDLDAGDGTPAVTTVLGVAGTAAAVAAVLWSVQVAVRDLSLPHVIRQVADDALDVLHQHADADHDRPTHQVGETVESLTADTMGWITHVDRTALLGAVPAGSTVTLDADVGDFVATHQIVARVDQHLDDDAREAVLDAIHLGRTRSPRHDLAFAIQPLVDIAEHAMGATSNDTSTAHEALVHLRAVLHEVLLCGPVSGWWTDGDDRWLRSTRVREPIDHVTAALDRLTAAVSTAPMRADLAEAIEHLRRSADGIGDDHARDELEQRARELAS